jgi:hypothetical protein
MLDFFNLIKKSQQPMDQHTIDCTKNEVFSWKIVIVPKI